MSLRVMGLRTVPHLGRCGTVWADFGCSVFAYGSRMCGYLYPHPPSNATLTELTKVRIWAII